MPADSTKIVEMKDKHTDRKRQIAYLLLYMSELSKELEKSPNFQKFKKNREIELAASKISKVPD